jgi:hypothetical protein
MKFLSSSIFTFLEIVIFASLILYLFVNQLNIPTIDEWELAGFVKHYYEGTLSISVLNAPHNECRMLYPHLVNLVIILISKWQSFYLVSFNMVLLFGFYLIFKRNVFSFLSSKSTINHIVLVMGMVMIFSFKNYEGIISGFILCHYLMIFATFLSLIILQKITWRNVLISCLLAHIATLSYATGFLTWVCILAIIILNSLEIKNKIGFVLFVSLCMMVQVFFYFSDYHSTSVLTERTLNPLKIVPYCLSFLSNNITSNSTLGIVFSIGQFISIFGATYLIFKFDREKLKRLIPYLIFGLFGVLISLMTAYGRASEGIEQSLAKRYCILSLPFTLLFFVSIIIHFEYLNRWNSLKFVKNAFLLSVLAFFSYLIFTQGRYIKLANEKNTDILAAKELVLKSDYSNIMVKNFIYPYPERLKNHVEVLKKYKFSLYYSGVR